MSRASLPTVNRPVHRSIHRQIRAVVRVPARERFVDVDAKARRIAWVHDAVLEPITMRKHAIGLVRMPHVFLDAEIVDAQVEMERRRHADGAQIGRTVRSGFHLVHLGQVRDLAEMRDSPACTTVVLM